MCNEITLNASTSSIRGFMAENHKSWNGVYRSRTFHCNQCRMSEVVRGRSAFSHGRLLHHRRVMTRWRTPFSVAFAFRLKLVLHISLSPNAKLTNWIGFGMKHIAASEPHILNCLSLRCDKPRNMQFGFNWNCEIAHADASVITKWK